LMSSGEYLFGAVENAIADADNEYLGFDQENIVDCPTDFSNYSVPECDRLLPAARQICYFDVIVGGDQFLDDIQYQPVCGNNTDQYCSFHGTCNENNTACICNAGWSGNDCETRVCPEACLNSTGGGSCDANTGLCSCKPRFTGTNCDVPADCSLINDCNEAAGGGVCVDNGVCECEAGYPQPNCTLPTPMPTYAPTLAPVPSPTQAPQPTEGPAIEPPSPVAIGTPAPTQLEIETPAPTPVATTECSCSDISTSQTDISNAIAALEAKIDKLIDQRRADLQAQLDATLA